MKQRCPKCGYYLHPYEDENGDKIYYCMHCDENKEK